MLRYESRKTLGMYYLVKCQEYSTVADRLISENYAKSSLHAIITRMRQEIGSNSTSRASVRMSEWWFWNMTEYINILQTIQSRLAHDILEGLEENLASATSTMGVTITVAVFVLILSPVIFYFVYRITADFQQYATVLYDKRSELAAEKRRSEFLLHQILPKAVADKLKNRQEVMPQEFASVTIFFSHIVDFLDISVQSSPLQVVSLLNSVYQEFDNKIDMYDVYKVDTTGK